MKKKLGSSTILNLTGNIFIGKMLKRKCSYVWGFELLFVLHSRNIIVISDSEENSLIFPSQWSTYGARDRCDLKATCCSVTYRLPKSIFVFVPRIAKA